MSKGDDAMNQRHVGRYTRKFCGCGNWATRPAATATQAKRYIKYKLHPSAKGTRFSSTQRPPNSTAMTHRLHAVLLHEVPHVLGHHLGRPRLFASILKVGVLHDEHVFLEHKRDSKPRKKLLLSERQIRNTSTRWVRWPSELVLHSAFSL